MPLKFRLKGLAETFVDQICCPACGNDGGPDGDQGFHTDLTRVTYDGIIVVVQCVVCGKIFVPEGQRHGIINPQRLRQAVDKDSLNTGQPVFPSLESVKLDVDKLNEAKNDRLQ